MFPVRLADAGAKWSGKRDSNPRPPAWKAGALPLSYSRAPSRRAARRPLRWWGEEGLNLRRRSPADLQSAPFDRLGISPLVPQAVTSRNAWRWREDLNPRPTAYKAVALPLSYASSRKTSL